MCKEQRAELARFRRVTDKAIEHVRHMCHWAEQYEKRFGTPPAGDIRPTAAARIAKLEASYAECAAIPDRPEGGWPAAAAPLRLATVDGATLH